MQNIKRRARPIESGLAESYIRDLNEAYNYFFFRYKNAPLLIVNSTDIDFVNNAGHYEDLVREILRPTRAAVEYYNPISQP